MHHRLTATDVTDLLRLEPLPDEGGYFRQTVYVPNPDLGRAGESVSTAILYLVTPDSWSSLHRLATDELFHFYLGDECRMVVCSPDGELEVRRLGTDLAAGCQVQALVPGGCWQGTRLVEGGEHGFALLGTTMTPGFRADQFALAMESDLLALPGDVSTTLRPYLAPNH